MNLLMGKICGSSTGGEDKLEQNHDHDHDHDQPPAPTVLDPLFSSVPPYHHQHHQPAFLSPPPYHHHHHGGRWPFDCTTGHEPSLINLQAADEEELAGGGCMTTTMQVEREHMFDKVVTPSDVGKLNRLVIPKQHAERYFPLDTSSSNDSNKGLLLNFEDRNGKLWRFRYSYWNSSQSYVMTKGWSRFVKEKKLDAGDIVSFQRGVGVTAKDRLFIDWRRRVINHITTPPPHHLLLSSNFQPTTSFYNHNNLIHHPWKPLVLQSLIPAARSSNSNPNLMLQPTTNISNRISRSVCLGGGLHQQEAVQRSEFRLGFDSSASAGVLHGKASSSGGKRRLRLFGVNMDCAVFSEDDDDQLDDDDIQHPVSDQFRNNNTLIPSSSSSFSTIPYLQLRPSYEGPGGTDQCNQISSSPDLHDFNITTAKPTASSMSLDLKM